MSELSVTPYFPFRRVVLTRQSVEQEGKTAWLETRGDQRFRPICSACGKGLERGKRWQRRALRDLPFGEHQVWIGCEFRKGYCAGCERIRVEDLEFVGPYERITRRMQAHLHDLCRVGVSVQQVAQRYGLRWDTVKRIDREFLEAEYGQPNFEHLRVLAVDEISVRKRHHYLTVVMDYETGRIIWTGAERSAQTLLGMFAGMTEAQRASIQAVAIDMHDPYILALREAVPQAKIVFDLYHVVAGFNRVIDEVRNAEYHKANSVTKDVIKGSKYLLLSHKEDLPLDERKHLKLLLALNQAIFVVHLLKEMLPKIWSYQSPAWAKSCLEHWCSLAKSHPHPSVQRFARMLEQYAFGIISHCAYPIHTSRLEGANNKIKVIKRIAYGFHDQRYFSLKIFQAFDPKYRTTNPASQPPEDPGGGN